MTSDVEARLHNIESSIKEQRKMAIFKTRSQRLEEQLQQGDIYQYDNLSQEFRTQIVYLWIEAVGKRPLIPQSFASDAPSDIFWRDVDYMLRKARGVVSLVNKESNDASVDCINYFLSAQTEDALDMIELTFQQLGPWQHKIGYHRPIQGVVEPRLGMFSSLPSNIPNPLKFADDAIEELNARFDQHRIGYEFLGEQLIRKDSAFIHSEVTTPAIILLQGANFKGASDEFLNAQEHYKNGRFKESAVDALKAFESTMKSICDARQWHYDPARATAKDLIKVIFDENLIELYLQNQFTSLKSVLESGVPTVRNKTAGHGQGTNVVNVPQHLAAYVLHLAAANIVFLVNAHNNKK